MVGILAASNKDVVKHRSLTGSFFFLLQLDLFHLSCSRPDTDVDHDSHEKQPLTPAEIRKTLKHLLAAAPCTLLASVLPGVKQSTWVHNLQVSEVAHFLITTIMNTFKEIDHGCKSTSTGNYVSWYSTFSGCCRCETLFEDASASIQKVLWIKSRAQY